MDDAEGKLRTSRGAGQRNVRYRRPPKGKLIATDWPFAPRGDLTFSVRCPSLFKIQTVVKEIALNIAYDLK